jgi:hypothetical protein
LRFAAVRRGTGRVIVTSAGRKTAVVTFDGITRGTPAWAVAPYHPSVGMTQRLGPGMPGPYTTPL